MSDEFNKGYFSAGPQSSAEAQRGQWAREADDRRARERREREQASREQEEFFRRHVQQMTAPTNLPAANTWSTPAAASRSAGPATLGGCVRGLAVTGAVLFVLYALGTNVTGFGPFAMWALSGAAAGAVAGVVLYAAIVVLRIAVDMAVFLLKVAFWIAIVVGGLSLLAG